MYYFNSNQFNHNILGTTGIEKLECKIKIENTIYKIILWDTCGHERYKSLTKNYYNTSNGIILVCDYSELTESFEDLKSWLNKASEYNSYNKFKIILCNKVDLKLDDNFNIKILKNFSASNNIPLFFCSAKTGDNVKESFEYIIKLIIKENKCENEFYKDNTYNNNLNNIKDDNNPFDQN